MTVCLVNDIYPLIYEHLDPPSKVMFALSCKSFLKLGVPLNTLGANFCRFASFHGYLKQLQYARQHRYPWNERASSEASWNGHFEIIKWLRENECPWDHWVIEYARRRQRLDIVDWAEKHGCPKYYVTL